MKLDVILPPSIEVMPNGDITVDIENENGYIVNIEYTLILTFNVHNEISIEYYGEDDVYLLEEMCDNACNEMSLECTEETFVAKQYEIAEFLGIKTIDINNPDYLRMV